MAERSAPVMSKGPSDPHPNQGGQGAVVSLSSTLPPCAKEPAEVPSGGATTAHRLRRMAQRPPQGGGWLGSLTLGIKVRCGVMLLQPSPSSRARSVPLGR